MFYKPQNIIGGDLYWIGQKDELQIFAVGDCTGHGISGALLSVLALSFLNYLVFAKEYNSLSDILEEVDRKWIETFQQGIEHGYNNDWMEIGLCSFNPTNRELKFAGAFSKVSIYNEEKITIFCGNRYPIGGWQLEKNRIFKEHKMILSENSTVYLYSDGFKDQLGEETKKKYGSKRLNDLLLTIGRLEMKLQNQIIAETFANWKGKNEQTDDICLLGLKL